MPRFRCLSVGHLLFALATPLTAHAVEDSDLDGVFDGIDQRPCDVTSSAVLVAPAQGVLGRVMFEDRWPAQGDLDFNDFVVGYNYQLNVNTQSKVSSVRLEYHLLALGGNLELGFGLQLPFAQSSIASVTRTVDGVTAPLPLFNADPQATFVIDARARDLFQGVSGRINSDGSQSYTPKRVVVDVVFSSPQALPSVGTPPYDLFIFRSDNPSHEIHLPQYAGTSRMDQSLFGTLDDGSNGSTGQRFVDTDRLPFALTVPDNTPYPFEGTPISSLMPNIVAWAASGGTQATNFYLQGLNLQNSFSLRAGLTFPPSHWTRSYLITPAFSVSEPKISGWGTTTAE